jgi:hypothetical protein
MMPLFNLCKIAQRTVFTARCCLSMIESEVLSQELFEKVVKGYCCALNCSNRTVLRPGFLRSNEKHQSPIFCKDHLNNGVDTHSGSFDESRLGGRWNCCDESKYSPCRLLIDKLLPFSDRIPITEEHLDKLRKENDDLEKICEANFQSENWDRS